MLTLFVTRKSHCPSGFSLVEVVLSLGIVSFTCLTFMGLLPLGMNSFHRAVNNTVEVDIVQSLSTDMQLSSYANVTSTTTGPYSKPFYYDAGGSKLNSSVGAIYTATFMSSTDLSTTPLFGSSSSQLASGMGTTVVMALTSVSQPAVTNYFPIILTNNHQ